MFGIKKPGTDAVRYEGPADAFVWRYSNDTFTTKMQIIVMPSQEAIFLRDGDASDPLGSGNYIMNAEHIPFLKRILGRGGGQQFTADVYFFNRAVSMGAKWGTGTPIEMQDPEHNLFIKVTAYGDYSIRVADSKRFLLRLVGTMPYFSQQEIKEYFTGIITMHVRNCIANTMIENKIGAMRVNTQLVFVAEQIRMQLAPIFAEYGLELNSFSVEQIKATGLEKLGDVLNTNTIKTMEAMNKAQLDQLETQTKVNRIQQEGTAHAAVKLAEGSAEAQINQMKGITEQEKMAANIAMALAGNAKPGNLAVNAMPGSIPAGTVAGGVNLAMQGVSLDSGAAKEAGDITRMMLENVRRSAVPGAMPVNMGYTGAGAPAADAQASGGSGSNQDSSEEFARRLDKLEMMHQKGMLTDEAYEKKLNEILNSI